MKGPPKYDVSGRDYVILPDEKNFGTPRRGVLPKEDVVAPTSLFDIGVGDDPSQFGPLPTLARRARNLRANGMALLNEGRKAEAQKLFDAADAVDKRIKRIVNLRSNGEALRNDGRQEEAQRLFDEATRLERETATLSGALPAFSSPSADSPRGLQLRAAAARRRGDFSSAAELDDKARRAEFAQRSAANPDQAARFAKTKARIASRLPGSKAVGVGLLGPLLLFGGLGLAVATRRRR